MWIISGQSELLRYHGCSQVGPWSLWDQNNVGCINFKSRNFQRTGNLIFRVVESVVLILDSHVSGIKLPKVATSNQTNPCDFVNYIAYVSSFLGHQTSTSWQDTRGSTEVF